MSSHTEIKFLKSPLVTLLSSLLFLTALVFLVFLTLNGVEFL